MFRRTEGRLGQQPTPGFRNGNAVIASGRARGNRRTVGVEALENIAAIPRVTKHVHVGPTASERASDSAAVGAHRAFMISESRDPTAVRRDVRAGPLPYDVALDSNTPSVLSRAWICVLMVSSSFVKPVKRASSASIPCLRSSS